MPCNGPWVRAQGCWEPLISCSTSPFSGFPSLPTKPWPRGHQRQVQVPALLLEAQVFYAPLQDGPGPITKLSLLLESEQLVSEKRRRRKTRGRTGSFPFPALVSISPAPEGNSGSQLQLLSLSVSAVLASLEA